MDINWITQNISVFLCDFAKSFTDFVADGLNVLFTYAQTAANSNEVMNASMVTSGIAMSVVVVMALKQLFMVYVMETDGDAQGSDPLQLLVKVSQSIALISCNGFIYDTLANLASAFSSQLTGGAELGQVSVVTQGMMAGALTNSVFLPLFLMVMLVLIIIMGVKAGIRGTELALMRILFPIFCVDLISTNKERISSFAASYFVVFFGYSIQVFCIKMFMATFAGGENFGSYALSLAWMFMAMKAPEWLQKYTYSSGVKNMIGSGARNAMMLVMRR